MTDEFEVRLAPLLVQLRGVLVARHGLDVGADIHAEVAAFAWEQQAALATMDNPAGYLYRVAQSRARRYRRWARTVPLPIERAVPADTPASPRLDEALQALDRDERTVVVLVHGYGYRYEEAAAILGWTSGSVRNRLHRGMGKLRRALNMEDER